MGVIIEARENAPGAKLEGMMGADVGVMHLEPTSGLRGIGHSTQTQRADTHLRCNGSAPGTPGAPGGQPHTLSRFCGLSAFPLSPPPPPAEPFWSARRAEFRSAPGHQIRGLLHRFRFFWVGLVT
jgi:hypothetical protein